MLAVQPAWGQEDAGNNVLIGYQAGSTITTGWDNIIIGHRQGASAPDRSWQLNIGGILGGNLQTGYLGVGIGTAEPSGRLEVNGNVVCGNVLPAGNVLYELGSQGLPWGACYTRDVAIVSDRRLKCGVRPLEYGLAELRRLQPVCFRWASGGEERLGFIAQDLQAVIPEAVNAGPGPERPLGVRYGDLVPVLVHAAQEQDARREAALEDCATSLEAMRRKGAELHALLDALDRRRTR